MTIPRMFVLLHLLTGLVALIGFWAAALTVKGSSRHKAAGKAHLLGMAGILASAVPITVDYLLHRSTILGLFLCYLFVLVGTSVWCGWRAVRDRRDWNGYTGLGFQLLMWLNLVTGAGTIVLGGLFMPTLKLVAVIIGVLGVLAFIRMQVFRRSRPTDSRWWLQEHFVAMIQSGAGSHVAFLFFGLPKLLPAMAGTSMQRFAWLAPIVIAGIATVWLRRKYAGQRPVGRGDMPTPVAHN